MGWGSGFLLTPLSRYRCTYYAPPLPQPASQERGRRRWGAIALQSELDHDMRPPAPHKPPPHNKGSLIEIRRALPTALDPNVPFRISLDPNVSFRNTEAPFSFSPFPLSPFPFSPFTFCLFSFSPFAFSPFLLLPWGVLTGSAHSMTQCVYVCREKEREREREIELKGERD